MEVARRDPRYAYRGANSCSKQLRSHPKNAGPVPPKPTYEGRPREKSIMSRAKNSARCVCRVSPRRRNSAFECTVVFRLWGVNQTDDIGEIVFNLIEAELLSKTDRDDRGDFHALFDLDAMLLDNFEYSSAA